MQVMLWKQSYHGLSLSYIANRPNCYSCFVVKYIDTLHEHYGEWQHIDLLSGTKHTEEPHGGSQSGYKRVLDVTIYMLSVLVAI